MTSDLFTLITLGVLLSIYSALLTNVLFRSSRGKLYVFLLIITGVILRLVYVSYTNYDVRNSDVVGHIDYIKHVMEFGLPKPKDCWECWQPPLYYVTSAFVSKIVILAGFARDNQYLRMLQYWSLFINLNFLFVGLKLIEAVLKDRKQFLLASALFIVWPAGVMYASRINNDVLFYLLFTVSFYLLIKWWGNNKFSTILFSSITAVLSLLTKTNGIIVVAAIIMSIITRFYLKDNKPMRMSRFLVILLIFVAGILLNQRNTLMGEKQGHWLIGSFYPVSELRVENGKPNFTVFDIQAYLKHPEVDSFSLVRGSQYFWNYLLGTCLLGEFVIDSTGQRILALMLGPLLLLLLIFFLLRAINLTKENIRKNFPLLVTPCISIICLMLLRYRFPYVVAGDFRYIFPMVIPMAVLVIEGGCSLSKNQFLKLGYGLSITMFIVISILYPFAPLLIHK